MNNFQTILVAVFISFFVFGVLVFSGVINIGSGNKNIVRGKVIIWGTLPYSLVGETIRGVNGTSTDLVVDYQEKQPDTYQSELTEAFAQDKGPDLFILPPDMILKNNNFIYKIPYASYSEKNFTNTYIDGANILLSKDGVLGYPLLVDPLVLYFNKNMLSNESLLYPPSSWDELFSFGDKLTKKKSDGSIQESMIALGQYDNVNHARDIISMLLFQSGNSIIERTNTGYRLAIKDAVLSGDLPFEQIIKFFLEFSNPSNTVYSWNRSMPNSFDVFTSGKLAFYIGYASELFKIQSVNPNLSFDVTTIPQTKGSNIKRTYGNMYTLVISKKSKNLTSSFGTANLIIAPDILKELAIEMSIPTANRSLLNIKPQDPYLQTFYNSAIISNTWLDPDQNQTNNIIKELIENSISNKLPIQQAIDKAYNQLDLIVRTNYAK